MLTEHVEDRRVAFQTRRMQRQPVKQMIDPREATGRIFKRNPADNAVNFIAELKQVLGQITAVLSGESGD